MIKRIGKAIVANILGQGGNIIIQIISVPLFLSKWGSEYYGEWILLYVIPSYLSLSDIGILSAISNEVCLLVSKKSYEKANSFFYSGVILVNISSISLTAIILITVYIYPPASFLNFKVITYNEAQDIIIALILYIYFCIQQEMFSTIQRADNNYARGKNIINSTRFIEFICTIILLNAGGRAFDLSIMLASVRILGVVYIFIDAKRQSDWLRFSRSKLIDMHEIKTIATPSFAFFLFSIANMIALQGSILVVGKLLSPVEVVFYNTIRILSNSIRQIVGIFNASFWPEFTISIQKDTLAAIRLHRVALKISFWVSILGIIFYKTLGNYILLIWTDGRVSPNEPAFLLLLISSLTYSMWNTSAITAISVNQHKSIAIIFLSSNIIALAVSIIVVPNLGIAGMTSCFILGDILMLYIAIQSSLTLLKTESLKNIISSVFFRRQFSNKYIE